MLLAFLGGATEKVFCFSCLSHQHPCRSRGRGKARDLFLRGRARRAFAADRPPEVFTTQNAEAEMTRHFREVLAY